MSTITDNQRKTYVARAMDDARRLADSLKCVSEAQAAAIIATLVAAAAVPIDMVLIGDAGDEVDCYRILDGVLGRAAGPYAWKLGSGCVFTVDMEAGSYE